MCGNVGEWVNDWYEAKYYDHSPESDPQGPPDGRLKVGRPSPGWPQEPDAVCGNIPPNQKSWYSGSRLDGSEAIQNN